jgi:hypothetical protein
VTYKGARYLSGADGVVAASRKVEFITNIIKKAME